MALVWAIGSFLGCRMLAGRRTGRRATSRRAQGTSSRIQSKDQITAGASRRSLTCVKSGNAEVTPVPGLTDSGGVLSQPSGNRDSGSNKATVGDLVQWTSNGVDQFTEPKKVDEITADGQWLYVADSKTGIRVSEVTVIDSAAAPSPAGSPPPVRDLPPQRQKQPGISLIVGYTSDGLPIYGHVAFDLPIQKGFLRRLGKQLQAMEAAAMMDDDDNQND